MQKHKAALCKLTNEVAEARGTAKELEARSLILEEQLGKSSAKVLTLSQDLTSAQENAKSVVQVLHCYRECLESQIWFLQCHKAVFKTELTSEACCAANRVTDSAWRLSHCCEFLQ